MVTSPTVGPLTLPADGPQRDSRHFHPLHLGARLEARGDELAQEGETLGKDLPSLPLLGRSGLFIQGWSHLLSSYPRVGKTELLVACVLEWCAKSNTVLYVTEEPRSIWQARLRALPGDWSRLSVIFGLGVDPERLLSRALDGDEEVVVVDSLRNLLQLHNENDNSEIAGRLNPWVSGAREFNKTLVMAHHMRKGAGDHGEGIAGGHALMGVFDMPIELRRAPGPGRRTLRFYPRIISPPDLLYERSTEGVFPAPRGSRPPWARHS